MGMVVQHNMNAINAYNKLNANVAGMKRSSEKLSSGYRINRAGDDAAGLAVSEKMRSQIKGLNQAIRNSQDGINMIQTFEGAAQETHNILQRMKELASQSANGTYDNSTDRAAIQLEFDQLNDELNQIADTDFNGTVVLNGGEMSDGLRVRNMKDGIGEFIYTAKNKADDIDAKKSELSKKISELEGLTAKDIGKMDTYRTIDENTYEITNATKLWENKGLSAEKDDKLNITFEATVADDGVVTYTAKKGAVANSGKSVDVTDITATSVAAASTGDTTGHGGFTFSVGDTANINVIFDATKVKSGDLITVQLDGPGITKRAPANGGFVDDSVTNQTNTTVSSADPTAMAVEMKLKDEDMTEDIKTVLDKLRGASITFNVDADSGTTAVNPTAKGLAMADAEGNALGAFATSGTPTDMTFQVDGKDVFVALAGNKLSVYYGTDATDGKLMMDITLGEWKNTDTASAKTATVKINYDSYQVPGSAGVDARVVETKVPENPRQKEINALKAKLNNLENKTYVSKADAFDNSTARMTYAENITLQTGARTKDSVNFTFKYNNDKTADMGELKANLNLSARADGLNTENLSLASQSDANHAIDQIDKAINKTSMVRASFGAIQNRLEHKITNLTTTNENLTEAESSIRDTDMASEMMNYTKFNILQQAAQSMLAQANQQPQSILQLLG